MRRHVTVGGSNVSPAEGAAGGGFVSIAPPAATICAVDAGDEEVDQALRELECSVEGPHVMAVLRDAVGVIERRALAKGNPMNRDLFLEQRIRDVLSELSRTSNENLLLVAVEFIDALLSVPYTNPQQKFTRLCRSLFIVLHSGIQRPAKEAQRVLKRMLELDLQFGSFDPPLKSFITKELQDNCKLAIMQLHGRTQQTKTPFVAQFTAVMLAFAATAEVNPQYLAGLLRPHAVQLATALAGSSDGVLRCAAYDCLVALFSNTSAMKHNEVLLETRRVLDEAIRFLNTGHNNESNIISTLKSVHALLSSRGVQFMEKQLPVLPQLCVLVTEQHRISKSHAVRCAVCDLVPIIAEIDICSATRRTTYCGIIMEPVKNIRDERNKSLELRNVAIFIQNVGYEMLDPTNRTNLDSILVRYIARRETQEECWHILAAICKNYDEQEDSKRVSQFGSRSGLSLATTICGNNRSETQTMMEHSTSLFDFHTETNNSTSTVARNAGQTNTSRHVETMLHVAELTNRCIPYLAHAVLSAEIVSYISLLQKALPTLSAELQAALDVLVDSKLKDESLCKKALEKEKRIHYHSPVAFLGNTADASPLQPHNQNMQASIFTGANNAMGRLAQYFCQPVASEKSGGNVNCGMATVDAGGCGCHVNTNTQCAGSSGAHEKSRLSAANWSTEVALATTITTPVTTPTSVVVPAVFTTTTAAGGGGGGGGAGSGGNVVTSCGSTSKSYPVSASELNVALEVFAKRLITTGAQLQEVRDLIIHYQSHEEAQVRQQCSVSIVKVLSRWTQLGEKQHMSSCLAYVKQILELYLKNVVMESDPKVQIVEMELLVDTVKLRPFLLEKCILKTLMGFLQESSRVREKTVELLVALTQEPEQNSSVSLVHQSLLVVVESCVAAIEYSADHRILIRHMSDLQTLAKFSLDPLGDYIHRILIAFRKQLMEESIVDIIALSILKTLKVIIGTLEKNERLMVQYQDNVAELYVPIMNVFCCSTSTSLSHTAIAVLVKMHKIGASPIEWNKLQLHNLMQSLISVYTGAVNTTKKELENVLTLFGQIGAVDPANKLDIAAIKKKDEAAIQDEADLELTFDYTVIVYRDLSRMLDMGLSDMVCIQAMHTLLHLVHTTTDRKEVIGGAHAVKAVLQIIKRSTDSPLLRIEALHILSAIISIRYEKISKTLLPEIVVLLEQLWYAHDHSLFRAVLNVVSALKPGNLSGKEQAEVWPWLYPRLVDVALQDRSESREFCLCVVGIILNAIYIPPHCISVVFFMLMQFVQQLDQLVEVRSLSLCASIHIVCDLKARQHFSLLMHAIRTLTRHCEICEDLGLHLSTPMVQNALKVLAGLHPSEKMTIYALLNKLRGLDEPSGFLGKKLSLKTDNCVGGGGLIESKIEFSNTKTEQLTPSYYFFYQKHNNKLELRHGNHYFNSHDDDNYHTKYLQGQQDITLFMKHVEFGLRTKNNKWREWFTEFQKIIIIVSPHPVFRVMVDLLDKHELFRRKLFYPSFKCLYESLNAEQMKNVKEVLNMALSSTDSEVVSKCLGLADYLDHNPPCISENVLQQLRFLENNENLTRTTITTFYLTSEKQQSTIKDDFKFESPKNSVDLIDQGEVNSQNMTSNNIESQLCEANSNLCLDVNSDVMDDDTNNLATGEIIETETGLQPLTRPIALTKKRRRRENGEKEQLQQDEEKQDYCLTGNVCSRTHIQNKANQLFTTESLVEAAQRTQMYDKVISYLEHKALPVIEKYRYSHSVPKNAVHAVLLPLAWMYSKREMQDSVVGLFRAVRYKTDNEDGFIYELLQWWDFAQRVYANKINGFNISNNNNDDSHNKYNDNDNDNNNNNNIGISSSSGSGSGSILDFKGYVRTLCLCGEWEKALHVIKTAFPHLTQSSSAIVQSGAMAAWILGEWDDVKLLKEKIPIKENVNVALRLFFHNVVMLHDGFQNNNFCDMSANSSINALKTSILQAKMEVDKSLKALMPLSYSHAYENLTMLQHFTEMEEQLVYMQSKSLQFRGQLVERWKRRFLALKPNSLMPSLRSLMLHSLVLKPSEMSEMILNFCERMGTNYPQLSVWAMSWLQQGKFLRGSHQYKRDRLSSLALLTLQPSVAVVYISQVWAEGQRQEAVRMMEEFFRATQPKLQEENPSCYGAAQLRLGVWKQEMYANSFCNSEHRQEVLLHFHEAIRALPESYDAWHSWGLMNYRVQQRDLSLSTDEQRFFVEAAHQGFVAAICRSSSPSTALPGIMRLLCLWVVHGGVSMLKESVADSVSRIPTDHWVQAIPQLIGHLGDTRYEVREVISMILRRLCVVHSQAVVFPLLVVFMSDDISGGPQLRRRELAQSIIANLPKRIYADAELAAKLLIDVSAIPIEKIREHLGAVSAAWNPNAEYEEDPEEVHRRLKTVLDIFNANRRHLLYTVGDIGEHVEIVLECEKRGDREKASNIVGQLVDEILKHIVERLGKEPQKAIEPLLGLRNLSIAVFGEYDIQCADFPTIVSFSSKLDVIPSRKRPRRIRLTGSNGCIYTYCLKGNEDIRMDERAMQLFGMVNVLLSYADAASSTFIHRFPVIPISNNVGLLGWVEHANTINNTICTHRNTISKVSAHHESNVLRSYMESFGNWSKLTMIQRTEVLEYIMRQPDCEAVDVSRAMWNRSFTAEQWLERRMAFTHSLATMSMVGYILGLGDRHLGNILLSMSTGKIVHIDFGDSFDVGRLRHMLPETIPFRLTRMLTNVMEVFGVDGIFRSSCTRTQMLLRKNCDSIMALLSAFVHDPIMQHKGRMKNMVEKSRSLQDIAERIRNKLRGDEMAVEPKDMIIFNTSRECSRRPDLLYMSNAFNDAARRCTKKALGTEQQVSFLIDEATRVENYAALYFGWGPLW